LLGKFRIQDGHDLLVPYLEDAEQLLEAMVLDVCASAGGECGPISRSALSTAALQKAIGTFMMLRGARHPEPESREALKLFQAGSAMCDCSRQNSLAAQDLAVRISRTKPVGNTNPLAAFDIPPEKDETEGDK
jgi:hypothetical protein